MSELKYIDWELLLTIGMVFSAEQIIDTIMGSLLHGFWPTIIGWGLVFILVTKLTAEEATENELEEED